jgi:hypothetical protein
MTAFHGQGEHGRTQPNELPYAAREFGMSRKSNVGRLGDNRVWIKVASATRAAACRSIRQRPCSTIRHRHRLRLLDPAQPDAQFAQLN